MVTTKRYLAIIIRTTRAGSTTTLVIDRDWHTVSDPNAYAGVHPKRKRFRSLNQPSPHCRSPQTQAAMSRDSGVQRGLRKALADI